MNCVTLVGYRKLLNQALSYLKVKLYKKVYDHIEGDIKVIKIRTCDSKNLSIVHE